MFSRVLLSICIIGSLSVSSYSKSYTESLEKSEKTVKQLREISKNVQSLLKEAIKHRDMLKADAANVSISADDKRNSLHAIQQGIDDIKADVKEIKHIISDEEEIDETSHTADSEVSEEPDPSDEISSESILKETPKSNINKSAESINDPEDIDSSVEMDAKTEEKESKEIQKETPKKNEKLKSKHKDGDQQTQPKKKKTNKLGSDKTKQNTKDSKEENQSEEKLDEENDEE